MTVALLLASGPLRAADAEAEALLRGVYDAYISKPEGVDFTDPAEEKRLFTPELAALVAHDVEESTRKDEVGVIDFDPFMNAQDWEVKAVDLAFEQPAADRVTATASFTSFGEPRVVHYVLAKTADGWRIADISWADGEPSFLQMLKEGVE